MMARHDISTDVFDTYVSDFHGTTTMLFDPEHPNADPTKAVCYDCHGVHDIKSPDDPEAGIKTESSGDLPEMPSGCNSQLP